MDKAFFDNLISDMTTKEMNYKANQTVENKRIMELAQLEFLLNDKIITCYVEIVANRENEMEIIEKYRLFIEEIKNKIEKLRR